MADSNELNSKIAEQVISAISGQIDFVHALSLATIGAVFAFALQIVLHNKNRESTKVDLSGPSLLFFGAVSEGLSVLCSLFAKGALTSSIAPIYRVDFSKIEKFSSATFTGSAGLEFLTRAQYVLFFLGVVALLAFLLINRRLLR